MCPSGGPLSCRSWRAADETRILDRIVRAAFEVGDEQYRLPTRRALSGREPAPQDPHTKLPQKNGRLVHLGPNLEHAVNVRHIGFRRHPLRPCGVHPRQSAGDPPTLRERPLMPAHHAEPPPPEVRRLGAVAAGTAHDSDLTPVGPEALNFRSYPSEPEPRRSDCPSTDLPPTPGTHTPLSISPQHVCGARGRPFQGRPGDLSHRPFAHLSEPEHLSCASSRRHERLHKPRPLQPPACTPAFLLRCLRAIGTSGRPLERALAVISLPVARFLDRSARPTHPPSPEGPLPRLASPTRSSPNRPRRFSHWIHRE